MAVIIPQVVSASEDRASGAKILGGSLRFNSASSHYLNRTPASAGNRKTWTWSGWVKRSGLGATQILFIGRTDTDNKTRIDLSSTEILRVYDITGGGTERIRVYSTQLFRDFSAWYHIVVAVDTTQATASNRVKVYVNGSQITAFGTADYPSPNTDTFINATNVHEIGREVSSLYYSGYLAEVNFIDGYAYDSSYFGFTDPLTNTWRPKKYTGEYGTNGFYLPFDDDNAKGTDRSGKGNNWTANNFTGTSTNPDVVPDSPSGISYSTAPTVGIGTTTGLTKPNNYCTLNPIQGGNVSTFSNGNLDTVCNNASTSGGTIAVRSGKWYAEFVCTAKTATNAIAGICTIDGFDADRQPNESLVGGFGTVYVMNGTYIQSGSAVSYGATWAVNDNIGIALDLDSTQNTVTFYKNGTSQGAINISNAAYVFALGNGQSSSTVTYTVNFGQKPFKYAPPTGFLPLCTANLPRPTIVRPDKFFGIVTWSGTSASQSITGLGFAPDFVWIKSRNEGYAHYFFDAVRTAGKYLTTNNTNSEITESSTLSSFDSAGFSLGSLPGTNNSGGSYVAWCWKAGGKSNTYNINDIGYSTASAAGLTAGTITPTGASVNTKSGFSIVTYTGNGTAGATVGHGLGVVPSMIIVKQRNGATDWQVGHTGIGWTKTLYFNTSAATTETGAWNNTAPTSTVFSIGTSRANTSSATYVAYCFSEVAGYSKFGSYTGNGSSDGPFVFCGFRPRWVLVKASSTTSQWPMWDTARNTYNFADKILYPNLSSAESVFKMDILSNGFKFREDGGAGNDSGVTYIFAAFAETPTQNLFGGQSNAR